MYLLIIHNGKFNEIDGVDSMTYDAGTNAQTGELNINGQGNLKSNTRYC